MIEVITIVCDGNPYFDDAYNWLEARGIDTRPVPELDEAIEAFIDSEARNEVIAAMKAMHYMVIEGE